MRRWTIVTDSTRRSGFTVVELLVVIGIIAVIAGISYSAFFAARAKATETVTVNDLHQTFTALELYRQDYEGGTALAGTSSELGLPNREQFYSLLQRDGIKWWRMPNRKAYGPIWYPLDPSDYIAPAQKQIWLDGWMAYSQKEQASAVILGDFNHTEACSEMPDLRCVFNGYGITLDGSLRHQFGAGEIQLYGWWEQ